MTMPQLQGAGRQTPAWRPREGDTRCAVVSPSFGGVWLHPHTGAIYETKRLCKMVTSAVAAGRAPSCGAAAGCTRKCGPSLTPCPRQPPAGEGSFRIFCAFPEQLMGGQRARRGTLVSGCPPSASRCHRPSRLRVVLTAGPQGAGVGGRTARGGRGQGRGSGVLAGGAKAGRMRGGGPGGTSFLRAAEASAEVPGWARLERRHQRKAGGSPGGGVPGGPALKPCPLDHRPPSVSC